MKNKVFLWIILFVIMSLILIFCNIKSFAYYNFLSPEANEALENIRKKHREKQIVCEKEEGIIWVVILPKNDSVETREIRELVYNDETGESDGIYNFTDIIIKNPQGWTEIIWSPAAKFHLYDVPRICFVYEPDNGHRTVPPPSGTPSDPENWYWLPSGDLEGSGSWIQWIQIVELKPGN